MMYFEFQNTEIMTTTQCSMYTIRHFDVVWTVATKTRKSLSVESDTTGVMTTSTCQSHPKTAEVDDGKSKRGNPDFNKRDGWWSRYHEAHKRGVSDESWQWKSMEPLDVPKELLEQVEPGMI